MNTAASEVAGRAVFVWSALPLPLSPARTLRQTMTARYQKHQDVCSWLILWPDKRNFHSYQFAYRFIPGAAWTPHTGALKPAHN
jgi:hypothetical protein